MVVVESPIIMLCSFPLRRIASGSEYNGLLLLGVPEGGLEANVQSSPLWWRIIAVVWCVTGTKRAVK
jgi:hypothetical protein